MFALMKDAFRADLSANHQGRTDKQSSDDGEHGGVFLDLLQFSGFLGQFGKALIFLLLAAGQRAEDAPGHTRTLGNPEPRLFQGV
jgi:hypothetical protein